MRFSCTNGDFVSMERLEGDQLSGDYLVLIEVRRHGFSGRSDTWIIREALLAFVRDLARLEEVRRGAATVESISPGELRLEVRATDSAGHMAVGGMVGYRHSDGETALTFAPFEFDPSMLPTLVRDAQALVT
jgi:hypothetical protein